MDMTTEQTLVFSFFMEKSSNRRIYISEFSEMIGCRNIRIVASMSETNKLSKRGFVRHYKDDNENITTMFRSTSSRQSKKIACSPRSPSPV
ncbi:hypothetical protein [uncultured Rikenella sp.]|uniref:hypothetical protein n=1 Tax=uncultured Rikenella sp. TaxID=368003 RepID=UPI0026051D6D|nr:hypothetical protein [uncultured Rikenella sp.]